MSYIVPNVLVHFDGSNICLVNFYDYAQVNTSKRYYKVENLLYVYTCLFSEEDLEITPPINDGRVRSRDDTRVSRYR